jgi:hypothetical protein
LASDIKENHRIFENGVLRSIFRPKKGKMTGGWRKLHNEELCNLYSSPNIIRMIKSKMRWAGHAARTRKRNTYRTSVGKPEEKRPLGKLRRRWVDNIKMGLRDRMNWYLAEDRDQ